MADPTTNITTRPEADAVIDVMQRLHGLTTQPVFEQRKTEDGRMIIDVLSVPKGMEVRSIKAFIDEYRQQPERRTGTATLTDLDSIVDHANRFKDADSAIFAHDDRKTPRLTVVLNYHRQGQGDPRFGDHRAVYAFPLSDEWQAWTAIAGKKFGQADFAEFLDERFLDVAPVPDWLVPDGGAQPSNDAERRLADAVARMQARVATPQQVLELSRGLAITENTFAESKINTDTGEAVISFKNEQADAAGQKVKVPNLFLIIIPVFRSGPAYLMAVRLQYRLAAGRITWFLTVARMDEVFDHAFREAAEDARDRTSLPLFFGAPEAARS